MTDDIYDDGPVLLSVDGDGVAHLRLNRPEASNGMDVPLLKRLHEVVLACHADERVRVVVLSGAGKHFCAGGDVKTFASKGEQLPAYLREATAWLQLAAAALMQLGPPVIAKVQGFAAGGGGLGLVCASDLVVAAESAQFMSGAVRVGMAPDAGTTVTLSRIVGLRNAMEILLANPTITASRARELGLVNRVVPDSELDAEVGRMASVLAGGAPLALAEVKRLVWSGLSTGVQQQLPEEARVVSVLSGTADAREGLAAVLERRAPTFQGR